MPLRAAFLDSGPLGLVTQRPGKSPVTDACKRWVETLTERGILVFVPEIADYEVRRELIRAGNSTAISRLDAFNLQIAGRYLPISTTALRDAARLWAEARNAGRPTAPPLALDGDVILAGQVLQFCATYALSADDVIVATVNVRHLARFVPAEIWQNIRADDGANTIESTI